MSDEKKKKGKRKAVRLVIDLLTVVCLIVAGYSIYQIAKQKSEDSQGESLYENMAEQAVQEETKEVEVPLKKNREPVKIQMKSIDFEELWALNEDVVAWLELPLRQLPHPRNQPPQLPRSLPRRRISIWPVPTGAHRGMWMTWG